MNGNLKIQGNQVVVQNADGTTSVIKFQIKGGNGKRPGSILSSVAKGGNVYSVLNHFVNVNSPVLFSGVQNANGVTNPAPNQIKVTAAGKYNISFTGMGSGLPN